MNSLIDPDLIQAYLETAYQIHGKIPIVLKVGNENTHLDAMHKAHHVDSSAFITAFNPFSQSSDDVSNAERNAELKRELIQLKLTFIEGTGQHPSNEWLGEPSFLVFGLTLEAAKKLGTRFEQNAIIWNGPDAVPQLALLR